jgi:hypothetical protein
MKLNRKTGDGRLCNQEILVSCKQDVHRLLHLDRSIKIIRLQIPSLSDKENNEYQQKLTRYRNECGCNTGAIMSVLTISIYFLAMIVKTVNTSAFPVGWSSVVSLVLLFVLSAGFGKLVGIMSANIKYRNVVKDIERKP